MTLTRIGSRAVGKARCTKTQHKVASKRARFPWINSQLVAVADKGDVRLLLSIIDTFIPEMNLVNISTALHRLAKITAEDNDAQAVVCASQTAWLLAKAAQAAIKRSVANSAKPHAQALSNATWSLAAMGVVNMDFLQTVVVVAHAQLSFFKPFELSSILWAFAKLGDVDPVVRVCSGPLFTAAARTIKERTHEFSYRCLVMSAWAFASLGMRDVALFRSIADQMVHNTHEASCSELAQTAWAFGMVSIRDDALFAKMAESARQRLRGFKKQELADLIWSCDVVGFYDARLFEASAALMGKEIPRGNNVTSITAEGGVVSTSSPNPADLSFSSHASVATEASRGEANRLSQEAEADPRARALPLLVAAQDQRWVCSVKNTFIEVDDSDSASASSDNELMQLSPNLDIIPQGVISSEKLTAYRLEYQRFRAGAALGAKGELCSSAGGANS
jgi:hypothetical protein